MQFSVWAQSVDRSFITHSLISFFFISNGKLIKIYRVWREIILGYFSAGIILSVLRCG